MVGVLTLLTVQGTYNVLSMMLMMQKVFQIIE